MLVALGWGLAAVAALAAALFFARSRAEQALSRELTSQLEEVREELAVAGRRLEKQKEDHRRRGEELADLRKRLDKAKRSRGAVRENERAAPGRVAELERTIELQTEDLARARTELEGALGELAVVHAQLKRERDDARKPREEADKAVRELETKLGQAQADVERTAGDLDTARHEYGRWRKRAENLDKVYMVLRGEFELAKDRLRAQEAELERLRALKVALVDPVPEISGD